MGIEALWDAVEDLHAEAHGDDKVPFRLCRRPSCRAIHDGIEEYTYELEHRYVF